MASSATELGLVHTYYVQGTSPNGRRGAAVLVHNAGSERCPIKRFDPNQDAVVQLAKQAERLGGLSAEEGTTLREFADEYGVPYRPELSEPYEAHPNRGFGSNLHIHVGPVGHLPIQ